MKKQTSTVANMQRLLENEEIAPAKAAAPSKMASNMRRLLDKQARQDGKKPADRD